jgi:uncharacterized protein YndB with AHSA1/START domain
MDVEACVEERIRRPVAEVLRAIVDPEQMSRYFITGASGPMEPGTRVVWEFADVGVKVPIDVVEVVEGRSIAYEGDHTGTRSRVTMELEAVDPGTTAISIREAGWPMDPEGVKRALGQTAGWTYFLCCLKAYLQHGIHLRLGLAKKLTDR